MAVQKALPELIYQAVESMDVALSIIDLEGVLLYYNQKSAENLDRKPEYIGTNVVTHHKQAASTEKLQAMLCSFRNGRLEPFYYEAKPYGEAILVTLSPILRDNICIGCTQTVRPKE